MELRHGQSPARAETGAQNHLIAACRRRTARSCWNHPRAWPFCQLALPIAPDEAAECGSDHTIVSDRAADPGLGSRQSSSATEWKENAMAILPNPDPSPTPVPTPPPIPEPKPMREPDPDRLPDEEPVPNPDENDSPPKHSATGRASAVNTGLVMACAILAVLPPLVLFVFLQRFFVDSIVGSAIKG
jgi:hypothetical protein